MAAQRMELSCLIAYEAGKTMPEGLADVDEAIDFLNFYAREEIKVNKENPSLISRGVIAVVSPWNFPIAIAIGGITAALICGNPVIFKPAPEAVLCGFHLSQIFFDAGNAYHRSTHGQVAIGASHKKPTEIQPVTDKNASDISVNFQINLTHEGS